MYSSHGGEARIEPKTAAIDFFKLHGILCGLFPHLATRPRLFGTDNAIGEKNVEHPLNPHSTHPQPTLGPFLTINHLHSQIIVTLL